MKFTKKNGRPASDAAITRVKREQLLRSTHFSLNEISELRELYRRLSDYKRKHISINRLREILWTWFDMDNVNKIVPVVEPDAKHYISEEGWIKLLSLLLRGTLSEKIEVCFKVYDKYLKDILTRDIVEEYVYQTIRANNQEEADEVAGEMTGYLFDILDRDRDGVISYDDYRNTVLRLPNLLEVFGTVFPPREYTEAAELVALKHINIY